MRDPEVRLRALRRDNIPAVFPLDYSSGQIAESVLSGPPIAGSAVLDSCGVGGPGSHLTLAGLEPVEIIEFRDEPSSIPQQIGQRLESSGLAGIFTLSYDLGRKLHSRRPANYFQARATEEPYAFLALFDHLAVFDHTTGQAFLAGNETKFDRARQFIADHMSEPDPVDLPKPRITSNLTRQNYIDGVETIREYIRSGDTYQTNLTQMITAEFPETARPEEFFRRLRREHPAPFAAFIRRRDSVVVSASPERLIRVEGLSISASPIKGTRPRGATPEEDDRLSRELIASPKELAENIMIVDLLRNDLGRICEYGSVRVDRLCGLESHPTLFHLVSTISGELRDEIGFAEIVRAVFPCGSITGAPKIRTMEIIDSIEPDPRGLSMGSIGVYIPEFGFEGLVPSLDINVAIRTMTVRGNTATFNVGGGVVIDSDPELEYEESLLKAKALLSALGAGQNGRFEIASE